MNHDGATTSKPHDLKWHGRLVHPSYLGHPSFAGQPRKCENAAGSTHG
jgi:hypothetical protein